MAIITFFVAHWMASVFVQTFYLHRYGAHRQFTMSKGWERFFHLCTYIAQGSSFLNPRGYAILHRLHHAYSDTENDPHSPENHPNFLSMMWATKTRYHRILSGKEEVEPRFAKDVPEWPAIDRLSRSWVAPAAWMAAYTAFYAVFAHGWLWALLPFHFVMGPMHGSIVNWCGHRYGYRNFDSDDVSRNTLVFDFVTLGELFQNNHHKHAMRPNFAVRAFELDPTYQVMRVFAWLGIIKMRETAAVTSQPRFFAESR